MIAIHRPCICLVTSRRALAPDARTPRAEAAALEAFLDEAVAAGIDLIQIRERDLEAGPLRELIRSVAGRASGTATRVVVNDRIDVALSGGASGVHLRADSPPMAAVRRLIGHERLAGRSIHAPEEAAGAADADYLVFGTVFESRSKPGGSAAGVAALAAAVRSARPPVLAIGGITPARACECAKAGAAGVAAIGVFLPPGRTPEALGPAAATAALRHAFGDRVLE